jgi:general secretion pathway protein K
MKWPPRFFTACKCCPPRGPLRLRPGEASSAAPADEDTPPPRLTACNSLHLAGRRSPDASLLSARQTCSGRFETTDSSAAEAVAPAARQSQFSGPCLNKPPSLSLKRSTVQSGAALLAAMLTVTLVATFAAAALWQQWRSVEVETAERARVQSSWILTGALDWARLILREDARSGGTDNLSEPWAVPLNEARLSSFLAVDKTVTETEREAFLSGQISDLQARLNVTNLIDGSALSEPALASFGRLFDVLGLPNDQLQTLASNLLAATQRTGQAATALTPLMPQHADQLTWLGLRPEVLAELHAYITLLPTRTPVNLNTASAEVIYASTPGLDLADAQKLVTARASSHFRTLAEANQKIGAQAAQFTEGQHSVSSRFFEVRSRLRLDQSVVEERAVLQRDGLTVRTLWRDRGAYADRPGTPVARP